MFQPRSSARIQYCRGARAAAELVSETNWAPAGPCAAATFGGTFTSPASLGRSAGWSMKSLWPASVQTKAAPPPARNWRRSNGPKSIARARGAGGPSPLDLDGHLHHVGVNCAVEVVLAGLLELLRELEARGR